MIYKKEAAEDVLVPAQAYLGRYYRQLHKYSFRLFLRDVIKHQDLFTLERRGPLRHAPGDRAVRANPA